ncbi:MAG: hypothetical protein M1435_00950, partial [Actinobacteria bacterium]|nr:hypothetical protein [Actinomycetota bacterium]
MPATRVFDGSSLRACASVELVPVIVSVDANTPKVLTLAGASGLALPSGYLDDSLDRTLEQGVRRLVGNEVGIPVRYFEQLYTFGNRERVQGRRALAVAYLALARYQPVRGPGNPEWTSCYELFPWEDWRGGRPSQIDKVVLPALERWLVASPAELVPTRTERAELTSGTGQARWDPVRVLDRYELAYELGLLAEAAGNNKDKGVLPSGEPAGALGGSGLGLALALDHRRIAAAALERLRGKLAYRPVVFEVLPETFTLSTLQRVVEAFAGQQLHKQNFRRLVATANLVEPTGGAHVRTGG